MTQIVISRPIYPSPLTDHHLYQTSICPDPNFPGPLYQHSNRSKQSLGAFKLYKLKRNKKYQLEQLTSNHPYEAQEPSHQKKYKLASKIMPGQKYQGNIFSQGREEGPSSYYDPNQASLWNPEQTPTQFPVGQEEESECKQLRSFVGLELKIVQNSIPKIIQINSPSQELSDPNLRVKSEPFVICKKAEVKKRKNKKKEKQCQGQEVSEFQIRLKKISTLDALKKEAQLTGLSDCKTRVDQEDDGQEKKRAGSWTTELMEQQHRFSPLVERGMEVEAILGVKNEMTL